MKYLFLTSGLSLVLASGVAFAEEDSSMPSETTTKAENVDLFFATDSSALDEAASTELKALADWARCDSRNAIILEGHADPRGSKDHNLELSGERAAAVRQRLIDMGVPSKRIVVTIYGELGDRRESFSADRRVTARATETPVDPDDLST